MATDERVFYNPDWENIKITPRQKPTERKEADQPKTFLRNTNDIPEYMESYDFTKDKYYKPTFPRDRIEKNGLGKYLIVLLIINILLTLTLILK
ncbi:hypothetical protein D3C85_702170 [compost metagenome]